MKEFNEETGIIPANGPTASDDTGMNPTFVVNATPASKPPDATLPKGTLLGPYRILNLLGRGGMGAVYLAQHQHLEKLVAIKILPDRSAQDDESVIRFQREMKAVGRVSHRFLVEAFDAGKVESSYYLAMEYVDGESLEKVVRDKGPMSVSQACRCIMQVAQGLGAAHSAGLVHRDIKPANMMLAVNGDAKLLDLGLALLAGQVNSTEAGLTAAGQVFGTPDYMAPEQWDDSHQVDHRADLYSLGCTLYFLLTAQAPYSGESFRSVASIMKGHVLGKVPTVRAVRPEIPESLNLLVMRLMTKDAGQRYQSAQELVTALEPFTKDEQQASQSNRNIRASAKPRAIFAAIALAFGTIVCVAASIFLTQNPQSTQVTMLASTVKQEIYSPVVAEPSVDHSTTSHKWTSTANDHALQARIASRVVELGGQFVTISNTGQITIHSNDDVNSQVSCQQLCRVRLQHLSNLTEGDFENLSQLRSLNAIDLWDSRISRNHLEIICRNGSIVDLNLADTPLVADDLSLLARLPRLCRLLISSKQFNATSFPALAALQDLSIVGEGIELAPISGCPRLKTVQIRGTPVEEGAVTQLQQSMPDTRFVTGLGPTTKAIGRDPQVEIVKVLLAAGVKIDAANPLEQAKSIKSEKDLEQMPVFWVSGIHVPEGAHLGENAIQALREVQINTGWVMLAGSPQSDELLDAISGQHCLFGIDVKSCDLSQRSIEQLSQFACLRNITLTLSNTDRHFFEQLRRSLPLCRLNTEQANFQSLWEESCKSSGN